MYKFLVLLTKLVKLKWDDNYSLPDWDHFCEKIELVILWLHIKVIASAINGAASFSRCDPIRSLLVVILMSILERNINTLSLEIVRIKYRGTLLKIINHDHPLTIPKD